MRTMGQVLELSTKPAHLAIAAACCALMVGAIMMMHPDAFKATVAVYLGWRVARWVLLTKPVK